jgi:hypothetical protein
MALQVANSEYLISEIAAIGEKLERPTYRGLWGSGQRLVSWMMLKE